MSTSKTCVYNFTSLRVDNADEDNWGSDGDEIYLVYIGFRSQTGKKGSTITTINAFDSYKWADGVKEGGVRNIPSGMGRVAIPVEITSFEDAVEANTSKTPISTQIVGVIGIALESDRTPWGDVKRAIKAVRAAAQSEVANIVENLPVDATQIKVEGLAPKVAQAISNVKAKMKPSFFTAALALINSVGDPDDLVGIDSQFNVCIDPGLIAIINAFQNKNIQIPNILKPLPIQHVYQSKGVKYTVTGNIALE